MIMILCWKSKHQATECVWRFMCTRCSQLCYKWNSYQINLQIEYTFPMFDCHPYLEVLRCFQNCKSECHSDKYRRRIQFVSPTMWRFPQGPCSDGKAIWTAIRPIQQRPQYNVHIDLTCSIIVATFFVPHGEATWASTIVNTINAKIIAIKSDVISGRLSSWLVGSRRNKEFLYNKYTMVKVPGNYLHNSVTFWFIKFRSCPRIFQNVESIFFSVYGI